MKDVRDFFVRNDPETEPFDAALEWLLSQQLKPGDEILQGDITNALGMVDPDSLGSRALIRKWEMARLPQLEVLLLKFESATGMIVMPTYRGSYEVLEPDEVSEVVLGIAMQRVRKALSMCSGKLARASKEAASLVEMQRRSAASQYVNNLRSFMRRERRNSLGDGAD